jgi:lipoprotein NlpI
LPITGPRIGLNKNAQLRDPFMFYRVFALMSFALLSNCLLLPSALGQESESGWSEKIEEFLRAGKTAEALSTADKVVEANPKSWSVYLMRGGVRFRAGKLDESLADFDKSIELDPQSEAHNWQRGIALYYAKKYQEGREQFELHRRVNPNDVENSVWHFMCVAKLEGPEKARAVLIPSAGDSRPPLMDVLELFRGKKTPEDIANAAEKFKAGTRTGASARFYVYLYIGLYFEAMGDDQLAREWIKKSLETEITGYMADVGRFHLQYYKPTK